MREGTSWRGLTVLIHWYLPEYRNYSLHWKEAKSIPEPPHEDITKETGDCLEPYGVLEALPEGTECQGGLAGVRLALVLVHGPRLNQVLP